MVSCDPPIPRRVGHLFGWEMGSAPMNGPASKGSTQKQQTMDELKAAHPALFVLFGGSHCGVCHQTKIGNVARRKLPRHCLRLFRLRATSGYLWTIQGVQPAHHTVFSGGAIVPGEKSRLQPERTGPGHRSPLPAMARITHLQHPRAHAAQPGPSKKQTTSPAHADQ
jgi:hypothetical protein